MTGAGARRQRVYFQQKALDENGDRRGEFAQPGVPSFARVVARQRGEAVMQQRLQGIQPIEVTVTTRKALEDVTSAWRIVWKGVNYNIRSSAPGERSDEIVFLAEADQSDA